MAAEYLVHNAFQRVEKELRKEFCNFFSRYCPEVVSARSATIRKSLGFFDEDAEGNQKPNENFTQISQEEEFLYRSGLSPPVPPQLLQPDAFDLVVLVETRNFAKTAQSVQNAKSFGILVGHVSLRVIPLEDAPAHVQEICEIFYSGKEERERRKSLNLLMKNQSSEGLELIGDSVIVNSNISSHNVYSDPRMAYTESHAMALKKSKF
jgi:hypothetical protein